MQPALDLLLKQLRDRPADGRPDAELLARAARRNDPDALEALVRRHAPLVLGVCRRLLPGRADAEDVFQATFLALIRRAPALEAAGSLGGWLHTVAYRLALRVRADDRRRPAQAGDVPAAERDPLAEISGRELCAILDEELQRLPEKYRAPVVLCCLEDRSREEAARELGWKPGSVKARLQRGREVLRRRLRRRGLDLTTALLVALATGRAGRTAMTPLCPSPRAVRLADAALSGLAPARRSLLAGLLLLCGLAAAGASSWPRARPHAAEPPPPAAKEAKARDPHGDPLPQGAVARLGSLRLWHEGYSWPVRFSPDGRTLLTRGGDDALRKWNARTGKEVSARRVPGLRSGATLSPDGKHLFRIAGREVVVCDVETGKERCRIPAGGINSLPRFAPDSKSFTTQLWGGGAAENKIEVWDLATGKRRCAVAVPFSVRRPVLSGDGKRMAHVSRDATPESFRLTVYDLQTGKECFTARDQPPPAQFGFSPDGRTLVATSTFFHAGGNRWLKGGVRLWDLRAGRLRHHLLPDTRDDLGFAFAPDGKALAVGAFRADRQPVLDAHIRLFDPATGKQLRAVPTPQVTTGPLLFSPDGKLLAAGTAGGPVRIYDVATGKEVGPAGRHAGGVLWCGFAPGGRTLASFGADQTLRLWDPHGGKLLRTARLGRQLREEVCCPNPVTFSPDGKTLALTTDDRRVHLLDAATLAERSSWEGGSTYGYPVPLAYSPDGKVLAAASFGPQVLLWDPAAGRRLRVLGERRSGQVDDLAFLAGGRLAVIFSDFGARGGRDVWVELWDAGGKELWRRPSKVWGRYALAASADGRLLVAAGHNGLLEVYEVATGTVLLRRQGRDGDALVGVAFSPDGSLVATVSHDRLLCVHDLARDRELLRQRVHRAGLASACFSPDGRTLATASADGTVLIWRVPRPPPPTDPPTALSDAELEAYWKRLAEPGPGDEVLKAVRMLVDAEGQTLAFFKKRYARPAWATAERLGRLVADLDARQFAVREKAFGTLRGLGAHAEPALRRALAGKPTLEARRRVEELLGRLRQDASPQPRGDTLRAWRSVWVVERTGTPTAKTLLKEWAKGPPSSRLTAEAREALRRLER